MNFPVIITNQGETIAVAYDLAGIELAVQEHYVEPDIYLVGVSFMTAEFSDGLSCDLEEITIYPATTKRKFRNTDLKVGDKVRVCMEPLMEDICSAMAPDTQYEGRIAKILEVNHEYYVADYACCLEFEDASKDWIDTQYLEGVYK